jgi:hypothetical protein
MAAPRKHPPAMCPTSRAGMWRKVQTRRTKGAERGCYAVTQLRPPPTPTVKILWTGPTGVCMPIIAHDHPRGSAEALLVPLACPPPDLRYPRELSAGRFF